jgi:Ca2+-binding EF-hand superfamily protein
LKELGSGEKERIMNYKGVLTFLNVDDTPLLKHLFSIFNQTGTTTVDIRLLLIGMFNAIPLPAEDKLAFMFHIFDQSNNGFITYHELLQILQV